jgi:hypothetical protein
MADLGDGADACLCCLCLLKKIMDVQTIDKRCILAHESVPDLRDHLEIASAQQEKLFHCFLHLVSPPISPLSQPALLEAGMRPMRDAQAVPNRSRVDDMHLAMPGLWSGTIFGCAIMICYLKALFSCIRPISIRDFTSMSDIDGYVRDPYKR